MKIPLTDQESQAARQWWNDLPEEFKGNLSIWTLLAMYARHVLRTQTVHFDSDEKTGEI